MSALRFAAAVLIMIVVSSTGQIGAADGLPAMAESTVPAAGARVIEHTLEITEQDVVIAGATRSALTINGSVPGPVLRFREGDVARIRLRNRLRSEDTSLHWHGLLVPNAQDGVPYTTTPPIHAGQDHIYEFPLRQSGTYWYHSHSAFQIQRGVYGAIVVEPATATALTPVVDRDEVMLLSDWSDEHPDAIMRTLMRMNSGDWYGVRKGTVQSIAGAIAAGRLDDFIARERARLPAMDVSDVAYDAFLVNGQRRQVISAAPGERVRLRVINAASASYFYLNSAAGPLTIIANDGLPVRPIQQHRLLIGEGETYDVLFTVPPTGAWEVRATAQDGSGYATVMIGRGADHAAAPIARHDPYSMNQALAAILDQLDESGELSDADALAVEKPRPLPPYKRLRALQFTTLPATAPSRTITMHLTGDMMRYIWSIDGKTLAEDSTFSIRRGEVVRLELINDTMMHHPMHLHGHFFRLLMADAGDPAFAPLKHTVDVPPMSRRVIEFLADDEKDWLFHCHLLYHHMMGMGRVFSYAEQGPDHHPALEPHDMPMVMADARLLTNLTSGSVMVMDGRNDYHLSWIAGWGERDAVAWRPAREIEYEIDAVWQHYLGPDWSVFAGVRASSMMPEREPLVHTGGEIDLGSDAKGRVIAGVTHRLPYNIEATLSAESSGDVRLMVGRDLPLTSRLSAEVRVGYDSGQSWMAEASLAYIVSKPLSLVLAYDSDFGVGVGLEARF